jgi:hypothetical protein
MARIDKYDPVSGGFRAPLNAAVLIGVVGTIIPVSLNGSGKLVTGAAALGKYKGVIIPDYTYAAGQPIDVMTDGEILETSGAWSLAGGEVYIAVADGTLTATSTSNQYLGHMVEADRLIVRIRGGLN